MNVPQTYFDAGPALTGGYRVIFIREHRMQEQAIIETASDVAACAKLCGVPVLSDDPDVRAACRDHGVRLVNGVEERAR